MVMTTKEFSANYPQSKSIDADMIIENLKRLEEMTAISPKSLITVDDKRLIEIDKRAGHLFIHTVSLILRITCISKAAIGRISRICETPDVLEKMNIECAKMGIRFDVFNMVCKGIIPMPPNSEMTYRITGIHLINMQVKIIREALEKELKAA